MASTKAEWLDDWRGKTIVCIASGPSLTAEDCDTVRASGHPVIVTNATFRLAPWAQVLMGHDSRFWHAYRAEVAKVFTGRCVTCAPGRQPGVQSLTSLLKFRGFGNSGAAAVSLAVFAGAARVVLLGFDAQKTGGLSHWHGSHPEGLSDAKSIATWPGKFAQVAAYAQRRRCVVVNASRQTALTCFPRVELASAL